MDRIIDFILDWMFVLPLTLFGLSRYKLVRVIGVLLCFPWVFITGVPVGLLLMLFCFCSVIEHI